MDTIVALLSAIVMLGVAAYAQAQIPAFTSGTGKIALTRGLLIAVGVAVGLVNAAYVENAFERAMALLTGFGLVHLPAAAILFIKGQRGSGKT
jgi:hypothetical protein